MSSCGVWISCFFDVGEAAYGTLIPPAAPRSASSLLVSVVVSGRETFSFRHVCLRFKYLGCWTSTFLCLFDMEMPHWCYIACFNWVDTLRSGCPQVGVGRCWIWCLCTIEAVRVVVGWVRLRTDGGLSLLTSFRDSWCPWVVGVGRGTSLLCLPVVEALSMVRG
jgi:hypothetical protein